LPIAYTDLDLRLCLDIAYPVRTLALLGNNVEPAATLSEPNLDLARLANDAAGGTKVEEPRCAQRFIDLAGRVQMRHDWAPFASWTQPFTA
jgi:hypothetical protein